MSENYTYVSPDQARDPKAGNLIIRLNEIFPSLDMLKRDMDSQLLAEAEAQAQAVLMNTLQQTADPTHTETPASEQPRADVGTAAGVGGAAMNVVETEENLLSGGLTPESQEAYVAGLAGDNVESITPHAMNAPMVADEVTQLRQDDVDLAA